MITEETRLRLRAADKRYRLRHPDRTKAKDAKRYLENRVAERARNSQYYRDNREAQRVRHRNTKHHISQLWFDSKLAEQDNRCAVCLRTFEKTPHIDHDHNCCKPSKSCEKCRRDLLCDDCNLGLGRFKDDPIVLGRAIDYLAKHKDKQCPSVT